MPLVLTRVCSYPPPGAWRQIGSERFRAPEILFRPELIGSEERGGFLELKSLEKYGQSPSFVRVVVAPKELGRQDFCEGSGT